MNNDNSGLKNQTPEQGESLKSKNRRKMLIGIFSFIVLSGFITYGIYQNSLIKKDNFHELTHKVTRALSDGNLDQLEQLASSDFMIGQPGTDNGAIINPPKVLSKIIHLSKNTKWSDRYEESDSIRYLMPEEGIHQLIFTNTDNGWKWTGFLTISEDELAFIASELPQEEMQEIQYNEVQTSEEVSE